MELMKNKNNNRTTKFLFIGFEQKSDVLKRASSRCG
jgi:hypothetical protein